MKQLTIEAVKSNLVKVMSFVDGILEEAGCSIKNQMQIDIAVEEIFVNVASYAYTEGTGDVTISVDISGEPRVCSILFADTGIPYDPMKKPDPDITLSAEERSIGGLGIFMVKKSMDDMSYEYKDGHNLLTISKLI